MISRKQLYAAGETFGICCTRQKLGGGWLCGGGGGGDSTEQSTTTTNTDKRQVVDGGSVGVSSDSSTVNVTTLDNGAIKSAIDLVRDAGAASLDAYRTLLATTIALKSEGEKTIVASNDLASSLSTGSTETEAAAADAEQKKKLMMIAGAGLAGYMLLKKG